jgi:hypothetical protein
MNQKLNIIINSAVAMKIYKHHSRSLQLINLLSASAILITTVYTWATLKLLPQYICIPANLTSADWVWVDKDRIWGDIRLMVTTYLVISLLCIYMQLTPFKDRSGYHKAQVLTVINLCICLVFSVTIIGTVRAVTW